MPIGLRAAHAPRIQELCQGDKRLLMRIGALLQQQLSTTEAVLEEIQYSPELRKLLMDRKLGSCTTEQFEQLCEQHGCQDIGLMLSDLEDEWRCLHLDDEVNNIFADSEEAAPEASDDDHAEWTHSVSELLPTLHSSVRTPLEGLLSAQGDEQRAAAIEQLRYASPSLTVVSELLPMILVDGADVVRERGIGLLTAAGANPVVTDLIRAMHRNDHKTLDRLSEHLGRLPEDQQEIVFAALIANATRGSLSHGTINMSCEIAGVIAKHRGLARYIELLLLHGSDVGLVRFIRLLQQENHQAVDEVLRNFLGQSSSIDAKILILLAHEHASFDDALMKMGVDFLISEKEEPKDRMGLANALRRMNKGEQLANLLSERAEQISHSRDSTVFWLLAELSRDGLVNEKDGDIIADHIRSILRRADGPHIVAILDQQLPALLRCSDKQRERMVEPLAELLAKFRDDRSHDQVNNTLHLIGESAAEPLWRVITAHPKPSVRIACAGVLPDLYAQRSEDDRVEAIQRLRNGLADLPDDKAKGQLLLPACQLAQTLNTHKDLLDQLDLDCQRIGQQSIDAQAYLVANKQLTPDRRLAIVHYLLDLICAELPDGESDESIDPATDEVTYLLDNNLSLHTDLVPRALHSLEIICTSPVLPQQLLRRVSMALINQWRKVSRWEIIWGPANIHQLAKSLASIASKESYPDSLRIQVAEALAPRANQIRIADFLVDVFSSSNSKRIIETITRAAKRIIKDCNNSQYADDEHTDLVHILARFLVLPQLQEPEQEQISLQIANTMSMFQGQCSIRTREFLSKHLDQLREDMRDRLDWLQA